MIFTSSLSGASCFDSRVAVVFVVTEDDDHALDDDVVVVVVAAAVFHHNDEEGKIRLYWYYARHTYEFLCDMPDTHFSNFRQSN